MKIQSRTNSGSVLMVCLVTCAIIGISMTGYLSLASWQNSSVFRSQTWNAAIPVAEAGIEEALSHLNSLVGTNYGVHDWEHVSDGYARSRNFGAGRYEVHFTKDKYPIITSIGFVRLANSTNELARTVRVGTTKLSSGMVGLVAKNHISMNGNTQVDSFDSGDPNHSTGGRYNPALRSSGAFVGAMNGTISGTGGPTIHGKAATGPGGGVSGVSVTGEVENDLNMSFPEVQPPWDYGSGGANPVINHPAGTTVTHTNLAYLSSEVTTMYYPTNPASPVSTNYNSTVTSTTTTYPSTSVNWIQTNMTPVKAAKSDPLPAEGTYYNHFTQGGYNFYDVISSYTYNQNSSVSYSYSDPALASLMGVTNTTPGLTNTSYNYVLDKDRYETPSLRDSNSKMYVSGTNVTLYVRGDFELGGQSEIVIAPGAKLTIFVDGDVKISGQGISNWTSDASKFTLFGINTKSIDISGNAGFTGIIYAPEADMTLRGSGGKSAYDVTGATVTRTATMTGNFRFHYDERLGREPVIYKFTVAYWREV